jgi:hypothetical protein
MRRRRPGYTLTEWQTQWNEWLSGRRSEARSIVLYDPTFAAWQVRFGELLVGDGVDPALAKLRRLRLELQQSSAREANA